MATRMMPSSEPYCKDLRCLYGAILVIGLESDFLAYRSTNGIKMFGMGTNINEGMQVFHCAVMIKLVLHIPKDTHHCVPAK